MSDIAVRTYNNISDKGLRRFPTERYVVSDTEQDPDVIVCRSQNLHDLSPGPRLKAVGRAGAGVNNIPVDRLNAQGIVVFRTPGANANAVKELVLAALLIACRNLCDAWQHTRQIVDTHRQNPDDLAKAVEAGKKQFSGVELPGRVLGVIGLGAIGRSVADTALDLGMRVVGYDPNLTVEGAWRLASSVERAASIAAVFRAADFVTLHVPFSDDTAGMIDAAMLDAAKPGMRVLNFARDGIVDESAMASALRSGKVAQYVTDFPTDGLAQLDNVIAFPHLGASTVEAEENCAVMVVDLLRDFLENGNIHNAVNFPDAHMPRGSQYRLCVANRNVPKMLGQISNAMADAGLNICDMLNQSKGELAYTIVDCDSAIPEAVRQRIGSIEGVLNARLL